MTKKYGMGWKNKVCRKNKERPITMGKTRKQTLPDSSPPQQVTDLKNSALVIKKIRDSC